MLLFIITQSSISVEYFMIHFPASHYQILLASLQDSEVEEKCIHDSCKVNGIKSAVS